jgi:hypothetical protein
MSQSAILRRLGYTPSRQLTAQIDGNGKLQQYMNQQAALKGLPEPFNPSFASALFQDILPLIALAGTPAIIPETGGEAGAAASGASAGAGGASIARKAALTAAGAGALGAISGTTDFLKWISWLFHPLNLLRAVEFLTGIATMYYGLSTLMGIMRHGRATHRTTLRSIFNWTPLGKARQISGARRRGRRAGEVQAERDVAYRGARQERARQAGAHQRRLSESTGGTGGTGGTGDERGT